MKKQDCTKLCNHHIRKNKVVNFGNTINQDLNVRPDDWTNAELRIKVNRRRKELEKQANTAQ